MEDGFSEVSFIAFMFVVINADLIPLVDVLENCARPFCSNLDTISMLFRRISTGVRLFIAAMDIVPFVGADECSTVLIVTIRFSMVPVLVVHDSAIGPLKEPFEFFSHEAYPHFASLRESEKLLVFFLGMDGGEFSSTCDTIVAS